jgi:ABC-2 type transport system ATP-binding protein
MPQRGAQINFQSERKAAEAMKLLNDSGIAVDSIEQNLPSLEDVFLTLIGEKKEDKNHG